MGKTGDGKILGTRHLSAVSLLIIRKTAKGELVTKGE